MKYIIGIDPGGSGGIAMLDKLGRIVLVEKMPPTDKDIADCFITCKQKLSKEDSVFAYLENVHSMPGQGVSSTFKFGKNYGALRMALIILEIPFEEPTPVKWQKPLGLVVPSAKKLAKTQKKNLNKAKAQELFPKVKKITHAIADAVLIAEYGRRRQLGI